MLLRAKATTMPQAKTPAKYETKDHDCWKDSPSTSWLARTTPKTMKTRPVQMNAIDARPQRIQRKAPRKGSMVSCLAYATTRSRTSSCDEGEKPMNVLVAANCTNYSIVVIEPANEPIRPQKLGQYPKGCSETASWILRQVEP